MGRAIDSLSAKVDNATVVRLTSADLALVREVVALTKPGWVPYSTLAANTQKEKDRQAANKAKDAAAAKGPGKATKGGSGSDFESLHPRNANGTFAYKEDDGGTAGIGTKDAGLPNGKPDGKIHGRISEAQSILVKEGDLKSTNGHLGVAIDGFLGSYTQAAIRKYQQRHKLKVTGKIDAATAKALGLRQTVELSADGQYVALAKGKLDWSPKKNWVEEEGGLPKFIEDMAVHMMENSGLTREHAIAASVVRTKVLAAKGNARATAALAQWEKMKASAHARKNKD